MRCPSCGHEFDPDEWEEDTIALFKKFLDSLPPKDDDLVPITTTTGG